MIETELVAIILAVGTLVPLLTSVVEQPHWSARVRSIMSVVVSVVAGMAVYVSEHGLAFDSPSALVSTIIGVVLASAASYQSIWKPTGVSRGIEFKTSKSNTNLEEPQV